MNKLGEIKRGSEIGYKSQHFFIWCACKKCGKERWVTAQRGGIPISLICHHCATALPGKENHNWRGGRAKAGNGYIQIKLQPDDFFYSMVNKSGMVREHRLVVAKALNRCLLPWEIVHHKEGCAKDDNRYPETLELLPTQSRHFALTKMVNYIKALEKRITLLEIELATYKVTGN